MAYNEQNSRLILTRLRSLQNQLENLTNKIQFQINKGKVSDEVVELTDIWSKTKSITQELEFLVGGIDIYEKSLKSGDVPSGDIEIVTQRLERNKLSAEKKTKSALRIEKLAEQVYNRLKYFKGNPIVNAEKDEKEAESKKKTKKSKKRIEYNVSNANTSPSEKFDNVTKTVDQAVKKFNEKIPSVQKATYDELMLELRRLDLSGDKIKTTVANLKTIQSVKNNLTRLILSDEYLANVKDFAKSFNEITILQNQYWRSVEQKFKPKPLLQAIKEQAISDTVGKLTEAGIGANIAEPIADILRTNITTGGSYKDLTKQLRESLVNTKTPGTLEKYVGQITTDAVNQYSNQYTQIVSNDLGYEWFKYDNTDILTTRPFCDAMTDRPYFHISEVPALLRAEGLTYLNKKTGQREPVMIYEKTGLPSGMIPGTDASNFFVRRGGYRCGHSIRPVNERQVPQADKDRVYATSAYKAWKSVNS